MENINKIGYVIFSDGYDENGNEVHKQEFITYKEKCEELIKLNKLLKNRWKKLKQYLLEEKEEVEVLIDPCAEEYEALCNISGTLNRIIGKIKKLEKENTND